MTSSGLKHPKRLDSKSFCRVIHIYVGKGIPKKPGVIVFYIAPEQPYMAIILHERKPMPSQITHMPGAPVFLGGQSSVGTCLAQS